jgi:uncharacterized Fe-S cluster-containing radical SAM superfamily protein
MSTRRGSIKKGSKEPSKLKYLHKIKTEDIVDNKIIIHEENVIEGSKNTLIKLYHKEDNVIQKIIILGKDDEFTVKISDGSKVDEKKMNRKEVAELINSMKELAFAKPYAKTMKGGRKRKGSKKGSHKDSKKGSRKGSKKSCKH